MTEGVREWQQWLDALEAELQARQEPTPLEPAPCDGCPRAPRCAAEELACTAFERFDAGLGWEIAPRVDATHERYQRIFGDGGGAAKRPAPGYVKR